MRIKAATKFRCKDQAPLATKSSQAAKDASGVGRIAVAARLLFAILFVALAALSTEHAFAQVTLFNPTGSPIVLGANEAEGGSGVRPGGGGVGDACPAGTYLAGFTGRDGAWMDALGILCAPFDGSQFGPASPAGGLYGKLNGGSPFDSVACQPGTAINYIIWNMTQAPSAGHVDNILFGCAGPSGPGSQFWIYSDEPGGFYIGNTAEKYESDCSGPGNFASGITVRGSTSIEGLDLDCAQINIGKTAAPLAAAPNIKPSDALKLLGHASCPPGYSLGSGGCARKILTVVKAPPSCPAGWSQVAAVSRVRVSWQTQKVTLNGITITCARPKVVVPPSNIIKLVPSPAPLPCALGKTLFQGQCVPACPNGTPMPPSGYCGLKFIPQVANKVPCADNEPRRADGSCPPTLPPPHFPARAPSSGITAHNALKLLACPDGQPRLKTGECPASKLKVKRLLLNRVPVNNGLH